jgi:hypothetical protein
MTFFYRYRWLWMGLLLLGGILLTPALPAALRISNAIEIWFSEEDPMIETYRDFQQQFGSDEVITVIVHDSAGIVRREVLNSLREAVAELQDIEGVEAVYSLANARQIQMASGQLLADALPEDLPQEDSAYAALSRELSSDPLLSGNFINAEGNSLRIIIQLGLLSEIEGRLGQIASEVERSLSGYFPEDMLSIGGSSIIYAGLNRLTQRDFAFFLGSAIGLIMLFLLLLYRSFYVILSSLLTLLLVLWITLGLYGSLGYSLTLVSSTAPILLCIVSLLDIVHILNHYKALGARDLLPALRRVFRPCLYTTLTTVAGFASFFFTPLAILQQFGLLICIGLLMALLVSFLLAFFFLPLFDSRKTRLGLGTEALLIRLFHFSLRNRKPILWTAPVFSAVLIYGLFQVSANTFTLGYFPDDHPVVQEHQEILRRWGRYFPLELMLYPQQPADVLQPETIRQSETFEQRVLEINGVYDVNGFHQLFTTPFSILYGPNWRNRLKEPLIERMQGRLQVQDSSMLNRWLAPEAASGRIILTADVVSTNELNELLEQIDRTAEEVYDADVQVEPTGFIPLYAGIVGYVVDSQLKSLAAAFFFVFLFLLVMLRGKLKLSLAVFLTTLLPVLLILGGMGLLGIPLDIATSLIAAIVLGITIDDTVHFVYYYDRQYSGIDHRKKMRLTVRQVGKAIFITSLLLASGFGLLTLAEAVPVRYFGLLIALAVAGALAAFATFLPALMDVLFHKK